MHVRWLQEQTFTHPAQQVVLQEIVLAERLRASAWAGSRHRSPNCCPAGPWRRWLKRYRR